MPTSLAAYKQHEIYCIEKHLLRNEVMKTQTLSTKPQTLKPNDDQVIYPKQPVAGMCKGYKVFFRRCLRQVQTKDR